MQSKCHCLLCDIINSEIGHIPNHITDPEEAAKYAFEYVEYIEASRSISTVKLVEAMCSNWEDRMGITKKKEEEEKLRYKNSLH